MRRSHLSLAIPVVIASCLTSSLVAQDPPSQPPPSPDQPECIDCGGGGPVITLNAPVQLPGEFYDWKPTIVIDWCDNTSELNGGSRWIKLDGVTKTSSFDFVTASGGGCSGDHYQSTSASVGISIGTHTLSAYICNLEGHCNQNAWTIQRTPGPAPAVSLTPYSADLQDYSRCAASCFAATYAQSTVPYFSLDTPRNVTLIYNGDRVDPKPIIHLDVTHTDAAHVPLRFELRLKNSIGVELTLLNGDSVLRFTAATGTWRLGAQIDAIARGMAADSVYPVTAIVRAVYDSGIVDVSNATRVIVLNENDSRIARGWTLAGIQRLITQPGGGALIAEGEGSATYFSWNGASFVSPAGDFSRLTVTGTTPNRVFTRVYPDSTRVTFNDAGRMIKAMNRLGDSTLVSYDGSGRVSRITDPYGLCQDFTYGTYGLSGITALSRTTGVTVQSDSTLTAITDPDNVRTTFGYDGSRRLSTVTDRNGSQVSQFGYHSASGKVTSVTVPAWICVFGGYCTHPTTSFAPWQHAGVPYATTRDTPFTPPSSASVRATITDPLLHVTSLAVNAFGQPTLAGAPLGDTVTTTYNSAGQPTRIADRLGVTSRLGYDAGGRVVADTAVGIVTRLRYLTSWPTPDSIQVTGQADRRLYVRPANGLVDSTEQRMDAGSVNRTRFRYDTHGRDTLVTDNLGDLLEHAWYAGTNGNRSKDSVPGGRVHLYSYDSYGRLTSDTVTGQPRRSMQYDALNRVMQTFDSANATPTVYTYDSLYLRSVRDPKNQTYSFTYNPLGWVTARTDPLGHSVTYDYDEDGLLRRTTNRRGQPDTLTYDALHRRLVHSGANMQPDTVSYASDGSSVTISNANAREVTTLDTNRRVASVQTTLFVPGSSPRTFTRTYRYRSDGLVDTMGVSGPVPFLGRAYAYNPSSLRLDSLRLGAGNWTRFVFNGDGLPTVTRFPDGDSLARGFTTIHEEAVLLSSVLADTMHYDTLGRLDQLRVGTVQSQRTFGYDGLGRLGTIQYGSHVGGSGSCAWGIDLGWGCPMVPDSVTTLGYDAAGNRTTRNGATWATYGTGNRIQGTSGCTYGTDNDGNVTSRNCFPPLTTFAWSADGRLDSIVVNGVATRFKYDALERLVWRQQAGNATRYFLWSGDDLLAELGPTADSLIGEYDYYGLDQLHAFIQDGVPYYAQTDAIGNVRALTHLGYSGVSGLTYDEWGASSTVTADRARWKGALYMAPEAGLYYMRNRWYETATGRFLSEDRIGLQGGINPYAYAAGNPVGGSDPSGLDCWAPPDNPDPAHRGWHDHPDGSCPNSDAAKWLAMQEIEFERLWTGLDMPDCGGQDRRPFCAYQDDIGSGIYAQVFRDLRAMAPAINQGATCVAEIELLGFDVLDLVDLGGGLMATARASAAGGTERGLLTAMASDAVDVATSRAARQDLLEGQADILSGAAPTSLRELRNRGASATAFALLSGHASPHEIAGGMIQPLGFAQGVGRVLFRGCVR